jgi:flagellar protein FliO/FliZ
MTSALLALTLALADPLGFPSVGSPPPGVVPAATTRAPVAAPTVPPAAASTPGTPALVLPDSTTGLGSLALPALALIALAAVTLLFARKRQALPRLVQVLETTSLGPRRSLVVARLGGEVLVIGASEAGLQLLAARPAAGLEELDAPARLRPVPAADGPATEPAGALLGLLGRLRGKGQAATPASPAPAFDALLAESAEDLELRRKLARGQGGSVR